jgi:PTH1 family peptidyl-tRNA hydrolase
LIKPATYVNNSGIVVKELAEELNIIPEDILVVYDDTNINVGEVRIRKSGSDGGHNGIKSIIYHLEADNFIRLRVGIGAPENNDELADYVLSPFPECDIEIIEDKLPFIIKLLENFITGGVDLMLNYYSKESNIDTSNIS